MSCKKCGAVNDRKISKHTSFTVQGRRCCGHCGSVMSRSHQTN